MTSDRRTGFSDTLSRVRNWRLCECRGTDNASLICHDQGRALRQLVELEGPCRGAEPKRSSEQSAGAWTLVDLAPLVEGVSRHIENFEHVGHFQKRIFYRGHSFVPSCSDSRNQKTFGSVNLKSFSKLSVALIYDNASVWVGAGQKTCGEWLLIYRRRGAFEMHQIANEVFVFGESKASASSRLSADIARNHNDNQSQVYLRLALLY